MLVVVVLWVEPVAAATQHWGAHSHMSSSSAARTTTDHCIDSWLRFKPNWQYFVKGGFPQYIVEMFVFLNADSFSSAPRPESKISSLENKIHVDRNRRRELHISEFSNGTVTAILQRIKVKKSQSYFKFVWTVGKVTLYWSRQKSFLTFSLIIDEKIYDFIKLIKISTTFDEFVKRLFWWNRQLWQKHQYNCWQNINF